MNINHPASLIVGPEAAALAAAEKQIRGVLCAHNACKKCGVCKKLEQRQHHAVRWYSPQASTYTLSLLEDIAVQMSFQLNEDEHFFFVIERADLFNAACANSMLKSLEEPPRGYHFFLLAPTKESVMPTIASRCIIQEIEQSANSELTKLALFFGSPTASAVEFAKELEKAKLVERDVPALLDSIISSFNRELEKALGDADQIQAIETKLTVLDKAYKQLPMPGSTKLFLRNLFLLVQ